MSAWCVDQVDHYFAKVKHVSSRVLGCRLPRTEVFIVVFVSYQDLLGLKVVVQKVEAGWNGCYCLQVLGCSQVFMVKVICECVDPSGLPYSSLAEDEDVHLFWSILVNILKICITPHTIEDQSKLQNSVLLHGHIPAGPE